MHLGRRAIQLGRLTLAAALAVTAMTSSARAKGKDYGFSPRDVVAFTAHTVERGELRLGVGSFDYGLLDGLNIGIHALPWAGLIPNAHIKYEPIDGRVISLAVSAGFFFTNTSRFTDAVTPSDVWMVPLEVVGTWAILPELELSVAAVATLTQVVGDESFDEDEPPSVQFLNPLAEAGSGSSEQVAVTSNLQMIASLYWQLSSDTIAFLRYRHLVGEQVEGTIRVSTSPEPDTTLEIEGATAASLDRDGAALSLTGGYIVSWGRANLLLGVGYGHWTLPFVNLVTNEPTAFLEADLYFRF